MKGNSEKIPTVALIGRPNVGKSTLFNRLIEEQKAIVYDYPGVTRDRQYGQCTWNGLTFTVIDTGGLEATSEDQLLAAMRKQTLQAVDEADAVIAIADGRDGILPGDTEIIEILRQKQKPFVLAVNKLDTPKMEPLAAEFYATGAEYIFPISALHGSGVGDLLDVIVEFLKKDIQGEQKTEGEGESQPPAEEGRAQLEVLQLGEVDSSEGDSEETEGDLIEEVPKIAVIGKPNAGKSTLINKFLGEERLLTLPSPGTTRDPVDVEVKRGDKSYIFVDTAGIRRKKYIKEKLEYTMINRTVRAIERSDVVLLLINAEEGITEQDTKVAGIAHNRGRGIIILVNKWDTVEDPQKERKIFLENIQRRLKYLSYAPVIFCSAKTGYNLKKIFPTIDRVYKNFHYRVTTGKLNRFFARILEHHPPPTYRGRAIRFYYITQAQTAPPVFVISANYPDAAHITYQRFIINSIRKEFGFEGVPIQLKFKKHH